MLRKSKDVEAINKLKQKMNIQHFEKIVLYMPTFREDKMIESGKYHYYSNIDIVDFAERHQELLILLRGHYLVADIGKQPLKNIFDVSEFESIIDLYLLSDILITDYSSAIYSYSLLKKPIISLQDDFSEYNEKRGLYKDGIDNMNIVCVSDSTKIDEFLANELEKSIPKNDYFEKKKDFKELKK